MSKKRSKSWLLTLLGRSSAVALAVGCVGGAKAQTAFQGGFISSTGAPSITQGTLGGTTDVITVSSPETIINWQPTDTSAPAEIDFLPTGKTASFVNGMSGGGDYTVLNRILPVDGSGQTVSSIIALNGTVQSGADGKIWFYAPGGIVAVGRLGLPDFI